jgi:hypothetical protein
VSRFSYRKLECENIGMILRRLGVGVLKTTTSEKKNGFFFLLIEIFRKLVNTQYKATKEQILVAL